MQFTAFNAVRVIGFVGLSFMLAAPRLTAQGLTDQCALADSTKRSMETKRRLKRLKERGKHSAEVIAEKVTLLEGVPVERQINAHLRENHTGIHLEAGKLYSFVATGVWRDGKIEPVTAAGFRTDELESKADRMVMGAGEILRKSSDLNWAALIGKVDTAGSKPFLIGESLGVDSIWKAPHSGELIAYANDVWGFYHNNSGCVQLKVTRLR